MPCPQDIEINNCARMSLLAPVSVKATADCGCAGQDEEDRDCIHCGQCAQRCPYGLDTPALLEANYKDYQEVLNGKEIDVAKIVTLIEDTGRDDGLEKEHGLSFYIEAAGHKILFDTGAGNRFLSNQCRGIGTLISLRQTPW